MKKVNREQQAPQERMVLPERKVRQVRQGHEVKGDQRGHRVFRGRLVRRVLWVKRGLRVREVSRDQRGVWQMWLTGRRHRRELCS